jgi:ferritin-like metal-binding protein YciE
MECALLRIRPLAKASLKTLLEIEMAAKSKSSGRSRKESPDGTELLVLELQEIYSAENQLARILPRLAKAVQSDKLRQMFEQRQEEGERIIEGIEASFEELEESPGRKKNVAAEGLINDAREHVQEIEEGPALDAVLIGAMQKTEHYCIAAWGTARSLAQAMSQKTAVKTMERALKEGKALDEQLTELAEKEVTPALLSAESEAQEEGSGQSRSRKASGQSAST